MLALGLSLYVFIILFSVGFCFIPRKFFEFDKLFALFLSPALGLSVLIIFIFTFNRLGFPIKEIRIPFLIVLLILGGIATYRARNLFIERALLAKLLIAPLGVLISAWPILKYGFGWISYVNDDMNNYVLAATRFYNFGFFDLPNSNFYSGADYSQAYYFFHVLGGVRPGSELFLAGVANFHHGDVLSIFMPTILTLQFVLVFSILALSRTLRNRSRKKTLLAYLVAIIFPFASLGYLYQLIGQVGGLAIGVALIAFISVIFMQSNLEKWKLPILSVAPFVGALLIWYPEFLPFAMAPILFKIVTASKQQRKYIWFGSLVASGLTFIVLNRYFVEAIRFGASQIAGSQKSTQGVNANAQLFPYFLKPHGLAVFLGISPLNRWAKDPGESISVLTAVVIFTGLIFIILKKKLWANLGVAMFPFIFIIFVYLIRQGNGFGAFKIAMYATPFLIVAVISAFDCPGTWNFSFSSRKLIATMALLSFVVMLSRTTQYYAIASTGTASNGFNEIQGGSGTNFEGLVKRSLATYRESNGVVTSVALNLSQIKLEAIAGVGVPLVFPTTDVFGNFYNSKRSSGANISRQTEIFKSGSYQNSFDQVTTPKNYQRGDSYYLVSQQKFESINKSKNVNTVSWEYSLEKNPKNLLIFIDSKKGHSYYSWTSLREKAVIFQPEKNPMVPGAYFQSIGNDLLFEVINPTQSAFLEIAGSTTVIPQYERRIPPISLLGDTITKLNVSGRGSFRFVVPLNKLVKINGHNYFQIHIDQKLLPFPVKLSIISNLYGRNIKIDSRRVSLFASNISVLSQHEFNKLPIPLRLTHFPDDLSQEGLRYSGIYEDGWISKDSYADLRSSENSSFVISGIVPKLQSYPAFKTQLSVYVDGKKYLVAKLSPGYFTKSIQANSLRLKSGNHHVELHFDNELILPMPDGRPAAAQITGLGFN